MHTLNYPETTKWVVAHNNQDVIHSAEVNPQNCFSTGQPFMEIFDSKEQMIEFFPSLSSVYTSTTITIESI